MTASEGVSLSPSRGETAVDRVDHARRVASAVGGEEGHEVADLARMRRPAERHALLELLVTVLIAELMHGAGLKYRDETVGADRAGVDPYNADVVRQAFSPEVKAISAALPAQAQM